MTYIPDIPGEDPSTTGFGEASIAENSPFVQAAPVYNFTPSNFRNFTATGGTAGVENKMFKVSTGTSVGGMVLFKVSVVLIIKLVRAVWLALLVCLRATLKIVGRV